MAANQGVLIVGEDMILKGEVRNCRQMEVYGYVEGDVAAQSLLVHQGGRCFGTVKTDQAEIHGTLQGDVVVKHLINIRSSGSVTGNVQYGQLAMEVGANLSAEVRNVPPAIAGDLDLTVVRGRSVPVTLEDLNAVDPDDDAKDLTFSGLQGDQRLHHSLGRRPPSRSPSSPRPICRAAACSSSTTAPTRRWRASTWWWPTMPAPPQARPRP